MPVERPEQRKYELIEIASSGKAETPKDREQSQGEGFSRGYWHEENQNSGKKPSAF